MSLSVYRGFIILDIIGGRSVHPVQDRLHGCRAVFIAALQRVGVNAQSRVRLRMAQAAGHGHGVDIGGKQQGGMGVPEIVEADALKAGPIRKAPELFGGRVMVQNASG